MEVKVKELKFLLLSAFMHLSDVLGSDAHFSRYIISQQVYDIAGTISIQDPLKMRAKRFLRHLGIPG